MVIFCKKSSSALRFRDPVETDFLGSKSREQYLVPKHEIDAAVFEAVEKGGQVVLYAEESGHLSKFQAQGALSHWKLMRQVLPDKVWENW